MPLPEPTPLEQLAALLGIEPEWRDNWAGVHPTRPETAVGLLAAMGVDAGTPERAAVALERLEREAWSEFLPPVIVVRSAGLGDGFTVQVPHPARSRGARLSVTVEATEEGGARHRATFLDGSVRLVGSCPLEGLLSDRFTVPFPAPLPIGYHRLAVTAHRGRRPPLRGEVPLIVCPDRAWLPPGIEEAGRAAGLGVALYGLRSERNLGVGDFGDLRRLSTWAARELAVSFVGLNPLHALRNSAPYGHSPYLPLSSLFRNFLYLDVEAVPEFADSAEARRFLAAGGTRALAARLRALPHVDYDGAAALKLRALEALFGEFLRGHWNRAGSSARRRAFEDFLSREGEPLERFAIHSALEERFAASSEGLRSWKLWPGEFRRPDSAAVRAFAEKRRERVLFFEYLQWQLDEQLAALDAHARDSGLALGYYHDLALAVDSHGADAWADQDVFAAGARVGAPPDDFNREGQDWGFPPPHPERDRARGYRAFAEQIRRACRHAGMLRIDHVMRLARLFWIPDGMSAAAGAYVRYRKEELAGILALESVRNRTVIVGEDLGVVPDGFREEMARERVSSCRLLWFERRDDGSYRPPEEYPPDALVSITTHDLATLAGFWSGADLETRRRIGLFRDGEGYVRAVEARRSDRRRLLELLVQRGLLPAERGADAGDPAPLDGELHNAVIGLLSSTPSRFFVLAQEDLFKVPDQQNVPGTVAERPNWVWKCPCTVEGLESGAEGRDYAAMYRRWIGRTGRRLGRCAP